MVRNVVDAHPDLVTAYAADFAELEAGYGAVPGFALRAAEMIAELWRPLARTFERCEAILSPVLALPAPVAGEEYLDAGPLIDGVPHEDRWTVAFTVPFNLCHWCPAIGVPSGMSRSGVPTGVQVAGRPYDELSALRVARSLQRALPQLGWAQSKPGERGTKQCAPA
jgi:amidase/aspartyl-tRNA(Asn)/glutamyl-tRNA(Gln) amidotransferase subunit A